MVEKRGYGLWVTLVKPASVILAIVIFGLIIQSIFSSSDLTSWIIIGVLCLLWLIYYFKFEFSNPDIKSDEVQPDNV